MADDGKPPGKNGPGKAGWLKRLAQALAREPRDREDVLQLIRDARRRRVVDADEHAMLEGALQVSDRQVRDIMIPRSHMVVLDRDHSPGEMLRVVIESGHSRFPVIGEDRDEVVGILLAKDLLRYFAEGDRSDFDIRECLREAVFIPESKRLNVLLREFRASHNHMAIVADEYGGVAGLLTIEDVLEQIVGEIDDEHDIEEDFPIVRDGDRTFTVRALTRIEDFNEYFGTGLSDDEYDTVGGLVTHELGYLPRRGETVVLDRLGFKVMRAARRRIDTIQVTTPEGLVVPGSREGR